jgi:MYXO-CTERM domain-containing protein
MALASICILLALAAVFGVVARRRRSSRDPRLTPS